VTPNQPESEALQRELERRYGIPPDRFCGLDAETMSRAIVAHDCGPLGPGEAVGYNPVGSPETRLGWLRQAFGSEADVEQLRLRLQFFRGRISDALSLDWMLPNDEFDRQVVEGLARLYPDLTAEARTVIAGNYSYSHAK
jgi:hypothetical protein